MGKITVAAVPIGNSADATDRLRAAIGSADLIAAEDTRRFHRLVRDLGIDFWAQVQSLFVGNEDTSSTQLVAAAVDGSEVLVVSDAGMPLISDPGYSLVRSAIAADVQVEVLPGPSAVTTALAISGLATDKFVFEGFPPRKSAARLASFTALKAEGRTMVFFESPRRLLATLTDMTQTWGAERPAVVCRELTKTYEEVVRGTLAELVTWAQDGEVLGEITLVVAGAANEAIDLQDATRRVQELVAAGCSRKVAVRHVSELSGAPRRQLYEESLHAD